jgi:hypothetical protein
MRTFNNVKLLGTGTDGATGAKRNEAALIRNGSGTNTITIQCFDPEGAIVFVGPLSLNANTSVIWPMTVYGFTASSANVSVYELF